MRFANFIEHGMFGKVGRGGMNAIKDRQFDICSTITKNIEEAFDMLYAAVKLKPQRIVYMGIPLVPRFVGASDAAYKQQAATGTGGYLVVTHIHSPDELRQGGVVHVPEEAYNQWTFDYTCIAQLELAMVFWGFMRSAAALRGSRGFWYIDNTAALMSAVKGRSNQPDLDKLASMIQLCCYVWNIWPYFEWIESDSNWTDGISRHGHEDTWHTSHSFVTDDSFFCCELAGLPPRVLINVFQFIA